ncbi:MAG: hypothetical protein ACREJX_20775, partial [Polyangiaceae bacterium]
ACSNSQEDVPSAVIEADPKSICAGDNYATSITLNAKESAPHLTLVATKPDPNEPPLQFTWSFAGAPMLYGTGYDEHTPITIVQTTGDRPLEVTLHVANGEGFSTDALTTIAITQVDADGNCPQPAP